MGSFMKIWKNKVWKFLIWLKQNNRLYCNMVLDPSVMDLHSDKDEFLPGLSERIHYDSSSDPIHIFEEETAGFMSHPTTSLEGEEFNLGSHVMLEHLQHLH